MSTSSQITIEQLEALAHDLEADEQAKRERLVRMCRAYVRILAAREPAAWQRFACRHGDQAGHWDSSFPPRQEYSDRTGPRMIELCDWTTEDVATEGGYYYAWRRVTTYGGLLVDRAGAWYRASETGTGRVGQFAAHPGDCDVDCSIVYTEVPGEEIDLGEFVAAEANLRAMAFPLTQATAS